jgi:hypothetical protein
MVNLKRYEFTCDPNLSCDKEESLHHHISLTKASSHSTKRVSDPLQHQQQDHCEASQKRFEMIQATKSRRTPPRSRTASNMSLDFTLSSAQPPRMPVRTSFEDNVREMLSSDDENDNNLFVNKRRRDTISANKVCGVSTIPKNSLNVSNHSRISRRSALTRSTVSASDAAIAAAIYQSNRETIHNNGNDSQLRSDRKNVISENKNCISLIGMEIIVYENRNLLSSNWDDDESLSSLSSQ